ncbi:MAG: GntR family transcriptional regulator [Solirubrobacteraceae bacterium]
MARLSKASHVPLYYQLAVILENRVESGDYAPGARFPSEHELCSEFGVSRAVVRPAVGILEREGRLERVKGRGTYVRPPKATHALGGLTRVVATAAESQRATLEVIEVRDGEPQAKIEEVLGRPDERRLRRVTAVLHEHGQPVALFWSFFAPEVAWAARLEPGAAVAVPGLGGGLTLTGGECVIDTSWSTEFESARLDMPGGTPILVARCTEVGVPAGASDPRPVEVAWVMCRADAMRVRVQLGPAGG